MNQIAQKAKEKVFSNDRNYLSDRLVNGDINGAVNDIKDVMRAKLKNNVKNEKEKLKKIF